MTGEQIRILADSFVDDNLDTLDALGWLNECLDELGSEARQAGSVVINAASTTEWYDLPGDLIEITEVEDGQGNYGGAYRVREGKIRFYTAGTYTVWYYKRPGEMETLTDEPEAHVLLHRPMALFLASRFKSKEDDENPDAARLMNEYKEKRRKALEQIDSPGSSYPVIGMAYGLGGMS